jgi:RNA recognition motif-containing protein
MEEEAGLTRKCAAVDVAPPSKQKEKAASLKRDMPKVAHDSSKDSITVFVSNLPYSMGEPEAKLRPVFEACGEVVEIRPIFSNRGDFRGYCYVQFKEEKSALQALELDRKNVEGRPMFVSPCVDKSKNPDFKVRLWEKHVFAIGHFVPAVLIGATHTAFSHGRKQPYLGTWSDSWGGHSQLTLG